MNNKNNEPLLVVKGLKKSFHTKHGVVKAIDKISFTIKPGEIMGLIGESGSGKTTVGRLLIRLYNDFSGYVSLDNQIISGKKISKKRRLFLHKNMQMIFQDPHASLDGQQNIYSILKEPLIVNKIMKNEYDDIFTDWKDVLENFKYSFQRKVKQIEYSNIKELNTQSQNFIDEWNEEFQDFKFNFIDNKIDNIFNSYFSFLDSRQSKESYYVKKVFVNNEELLQEYFLYQKNYRNNDLVEHETKLKKSKEKLDLTIELSTQSLNKYLIGMEKIKLKTKISEDKKNRSEDVTNVKNILLSYLLEYKNTYLSFNESANKESDYIKFNKLKKKYLVYKHAYHVLKINIEKLIYSSLQDIEKLITTLNESISNCLKFLKQIDIDEPSFVKKIKKTIKENFDFSILTFIGISSTNKLAIDESIIDNKLSLDEKTQVLKIKSSPHKTDIDILSAKKDFQNTVDEHKWNLEIFLREFEGEMQLLTEDIQIEHELNKQYQIDIDILNNKFDEIHNNFILELKKYCLEQKFVKEKTNQLVGVYNDKIKQKKESLKSFEIEIINLKSDFLKMKHLVGIESNNLSKIFVKKILLKEKIYKSLEEVGLLRQFAWRYPHEFSGGQRQRIVIARALISNPKLIIADEPIASLDISIQAQVVNLLKDLCKTKNVALIFIAHDLSMVEYIADKINIMHLGKIVEYGETSKVYANPIHPYTINLFESIPKISNANKPFEASNFDLNYLEEQSKSTQSEEFFKCSDNHYVYSTKDQYNRWMGFENNITRKAFNVKQKNNVWKDGQKIEESTIIDVTK